MGKKKMGKQITEQKENKKEAIRQDCLDDLENRINDVHYRMQCQYAINVVELKIQMLSEEMTEERGRKIVSCISNRIKTAESVRKKLQKKKQS